MKKMQTKECFPYEFNVGDLVLLWDADEGFEDDYVQASWVDESLIENYGPPENKKMVQMLKVVAMSNDDMPVFSNVIYGYKTNTFEDDFDDIRMLEVIDMGDCLELEFR